MSRILSTSFAMASLLFAACGVPDDGSLTSEEAQLRHSRHCNGTVCTGTTRVGEACGGILGGRTSCGDGAYCAYPIKLQCGSGDQQGVCTAQPAVCPRGIRYDPVCACDGNTYDGGCNAAAAGTSVQRVGACDQNVTGGWEYLSNQRYSYTFDPDGSFTRSVRPSCVTTPPFCPLFIIQSGGVYNLQGRMLSLAYTTASRQGASAQFIIEGTEQTAHLRGTDDGVQLDLTRTR